MPSNLKILKVMTIGKGQTMTIAIDESEPEDSPYRWTADVTCTGEEPFVVPLHWHENHQERISVLEGRVEVTVNGTTTTIGPSDPAILIPRRTIHGIKGFQGERLVMRENPDPAGVYKALFFTDLFSQGDFARTGLLHLLRACYDGDTYFVLPLRSQILDKAFVTIFGRIAHMFVAKRKESLE